MKLMAVFGENEISSSVGLMLLGLLRHIDREEFSVTAAAPEDSLIVEQIEKLDIPVIKMRFSADTSYKRYASAELRALYDNEKPNVVHAFSSPIAVKIAKKCGVERVFETRRYKREKSEKGIFGVIHSGFSADRMILCSEAERSLLFGGRYSDRVSVIPCGAEPLAHLSCGMCEKKRRELGISESDTVFTYISRLEAEKDHKTFLEAASDALKINSDMKFLVVGHGSLSDSLNALCDDLEISDNVIFTGYCPDISPILSVTDVSVNCALEAVTNLSLILGMSLGIPSVVSDCDTNRAVIKNGISGLVFDRGDRDMLSTAMLTLAENVKLRADIGERAKREFAENHSDAVMARRICELYRSETPKKSKRR